MANDSDMIDEIVKAGIEAFIKSDKADDQGPKEDKDTEKDTKKEAPKDPPSKDEKAPSKKDESDGDTEAPKTDEPAPAGEKPAEPLPTAPMDFSSMSDDDLVMFIEMAADRLGLDNIVDGDQEPASKEIGEAAADLDPDGL